MVWTSPDFDTSRTGSCCHSRLSTVVRLIFNSADIIVSTRLDVPPAFSWPFPLSADRIFNSGVDDYKADTAAKELATTLGTGLKFCSDTFPILSSVIQLIVEVTAATDHFSRDAHYAPAAWQLGRARNLAQWTLCELKHTRNYFDSLQVDREQGTITAYPSPPATLLASHPEPSQLNLLEVTRLTLHLFSDLVLFPIPSTTSVKTMLLYKLRKELQPYTTSVQAHQPQPSTAAQQLPRMALHPAEMQDFLTWVLTICAISSLNTPDQRFHLHLFHTHLTHPNFNNGTMNCDILQTVRGTCQRFLWWDIVCLPRLQAVFSRTREMRRT